MIPIEQLIFILDKVGIVACAFTGVSLGVKKNLDLFGLMVVGVASAIGGGIVRDVILGRVPLVISNITYLEFAVVTSIIAVLLFYFKRKIPNKIILYADMLGLGAFAAAGATVSLSLHLGLLHTILLSIISAVGGGVIRDIVLNDIPHILKREIYASAAGIGGMIAYLTFSINSDMNASAFFALISTIIVRLIADKKKFNLPKLEQ